MIDGFGAGNSYSDVYFTLQSASEKENYALKKGLILIQRDKLFSRWKERYLILTKDYLACFKKSSKIASSAMGGFIFKVNDKIFFS